MKDLFQTKRDSGGHVQHHESPQAHWTNMFMWMRTWVLPFPWMAWCHSASMVLGCRCDTWSPGHPGPGSTHYPQGPDEHNSKHEAQITTPAKTQRHKPSCRVQSRPFLCTISRTLHNPPKAPWEILICVVAPKTNTLRSCSCSLVPVGKLSRAS